jgi:hypothetical protein
MLKGEERTVSFRVKAPEGDTSSPFGGEASIAGNVVDRGMVTVQYPHIPAQTMFPPATGRFVRLHVRRTKLRVGYIAGSGDGVPAALKQLGYTVEFLTDDDLENSKLGGCDVIIAGVRSYNTRPKLRLMQSRLMQFVHDGGTYIVQYVTPQKGESDNIGPYPFNVSRDRVSVEDVPVTFLDPGNVLLTKPNEITHKDFDGWVQERGLSFADSWDSNYTAVLACNDPGEPARKGGLLFARYGKGCYVYTGYSWFRQLPAGVPGAYRIFTNLIEANKQKKVRFGIGN